MEIDQTKVLTNDSKTFLFACLFYVLYYFIILMSVKKDRSIFFIYSCELLFHHRRIKRIVFISAADIKRQYHRISTIFSIFLDLHRPTMSMTSTSSSTTTQIQQFIPIFRVYKYLVPYPTGIYLGSCPTGSESCRAMLYLTLPKTHTICPNIIISGF